MVLCDNRLFAAKGKKKDVAYQQEAFCINAMQMSLVFIHLTLAAGKRVMNKTTSAYENEMPFRSTLEEFLWVAHTNEQCKVCNKFRSIDNVY